MSDNYYVYLHLKITTGVPFYVGKGKGSRAFEFGKSARSLHWQGVQKKHGVFVKFYAKDLTESQAHALEKELIQRLRCQEIPLVNKTDGGDGMSGYNFTDEQLLNISRGLKKSVGVNYVKPTPVRKKSAGIRNHNADRVKYFFLRLEDGFIFNGTRSELIEKFSVQRCQIKKLFYKSNPRRSAEGWRLANEGEINEYTSKTKS